MKRPNDRVCCIDGCTRTTMSPQHPKCSMHYKRIARGQDLHAPIDEMQIRGTAEQLSPLEECLLAFSGWMNAPDDDDKASMLLQRFARAAIRYADKGDAQQCLLAGASTESRLLSRLGGRWRNVALSAEERTEIARQGGLAAARSMSWRRRRERARTAAKARWARRGPPKGGT